MRTEIDHVAEFCKTNLQLGKVELPEEYGYSSLPLCVIDAVFSIGVNYSATKNTVARFCKYLRDDPNPLSISGLISIYSEHDSEWMACNVYENRQRTSTKNGILKSEAVLMFSEVLLSYEANYIKDVEKILGDSGFEAAIMKIPGQRSGISLRYFYMLAGFENYIKPDRMVKKFLRNVLGRSLNDKECQEVLAGACEALSFDYPDLTPRSLDYQIWSYQRESKKPGIFHC